MIDNAFFPRVVVPVATLTLFFVHRVALNVYRLVRPVTLIDLRSGVLLMMTATVMIVVVLCNDCCCGARIVDRLIEFCVLFI